MLRHSMYSMAAALMLLGAGSLWAEEAATAVTLKGTMVCAKCELHEGDMCQDVLKVKDGDKVVLYYLTEGKTAKDFHKNVCHGPKENVSVTGVVGEKDGKKTIEARKIES